MRALLSQHAAAALVALSAARRGLRLSDVADLIGAPLSSAQRTVQALEAGGLVLRDREERPRYRLAPDVPREALVQLAVWRLSATELAVLRQRTAAMTEPVEATGVDLVAATKRASSNPRDAERLRDMAVRLIWWQRPSTTLKNPARLIAQAMAVGTWEDANFVTEVYGEDALRHILASEPPGIFTARSWSYWHARLGYRRTPPLPERVLV